MTRARPVRIRVCGQNMTEGPVTATMAAADVVITQERPSRRVMRRGLKRPGRRMRHFFPVRDKHQSLHWDPAVITITATGWDRFHRSGKAERFGFGSPARGFIWAEGYLTEDPDVLVAIGGLWLLNSWKPAGDPDHDTDARADVVRDRSLPVIAHRTEGWVRRGLAAIVEGDGNSIPWDGEVPGLTQIKARGLDRAWVGEDGVFKVTAWPWEGPKTGVGNDRQHGSVNFILTYTPKENRR